MRACTRTISARYIGEWADSPSRARAQVWASAGWGSGPWTYRRDLAQKDLGSGACAACGGGCKWGLGWRTRIVEEEVEWSSLELVDELDSRTCEGGSGMGVAGGMRRALGGRACVQGRAGSLSSGWREALHLPLAELVGHGPCTCRGQPREPALSHLARMAHAECVPF